MCQYVNSILFLISFLDRDRRYRAPDTSDSGIRWKGPRYRSSWDRSRKVDQPLDARDFVRTITLNNTLKC